MFLIGCSPKGRHTEQHDIFFTIAENVQEVIPMAAAFWPEAKNTLHFDAWREVTRVGEYEISVVEKGLENSEPAQLFFINLGGYKKDEFEEFHYKMLVAAQDKTEAVKQAKQTAFYKHVGFKGAPSHIDDKYGVGVDDFYAIADILPKGISEKYSIQLKAAEESVPADEFHLGYFIPSKVDKWAPKS